MTTVQYPSMHANGVENAAHGLEPSFNNDAHYNTDAFAFDPFPSASMAGSMNASPVSSRAGPSTLPTPGSTSEVNRSKKRSSNDNHSARTTSPLSESSSEPTDKVVKRQRNTEAARRYRQRKVDRVTELEEALAAMTKERDDFKLKLARSEAEVDVLRRLVGKGD